MLQRTRGQTIASVKTSVAIAAMRRVILPVSAVREIMVDPTIEETPTVDLEVAPPTDMEEEGIANVEMIEVVGITIVVAIAVVVAVEAAITTDALITGETTTTPAHALDQDLSLKTTVDHAPTHQEDKTVMSTVVAMIIVAMTAMIVMIATEMTAETVEVVTTVITTLTETEEIPAVVDAIVETVVVEREAMITRTAVVTTSPTMAMMTTTATMTMTTAMVLATTMAMVLATTMVACMTTMIAAWADITPNMTTMVTTVTTTPSPTLAKVTNSKHPQLAPPLIMLRFLTQKSRSRMVMPEVALLNKLSTSSSQLSSNSLQRLLWQMMARWRNLPQLPNKHQLKDRWISLID